MGGSPNDGPAAGSEQVADAATVATATEPTIRIVVAPMPKEIVRRGMLAPSMIAHFLVAKYVMGVPFYRLEQRCAIRRVARSIAARCAATPRTSARPSACIVEAMREDALANAFCISTDATGVASSRSPLDDGQAAAMRKGTTSCSSPIAITSSSSTRPSRPALPSAKCSVASPATCRPTPRASTTRCSGRTAPAARRRHECRTAAATRSAAGRTRAASSGRRQSQASDRRCEGSRAHRADLRSRSRVLGRPRPTSAALRTLHLRRTSTRSSRGSMPSTSVSGPRARRHRARLRASASKRPLRRFLDDGRLALDNNAAERELRSHRHRAQELAVLRQRRSRPGRRRTCSP